MKVDGWSLIYPDGPESLVKGVSYNILWNAPSGASVKIELFSNITYYATIAEEIPNTGIYEWAIPAHMATGLNYSIQISDIHDSGLQTKSQNRFRILEPGIPSTYTDSRDGRTYRTVILGDQTWMAENFNYDPGDGSFCYLNDPAYCETQGRLYAREAAITHRPEGWHLPTDKEWKQLETYLGMATGELEIFGNRGHSVGDILRPEGGIGFDAIFGVYYNHCFDQFGHKSYEAHYWTSSLTEDGNPILRIIGKMGEIGRLASSCHMGSSVRYVKDTP
jgi:uncharacterized protein (TIGR02145 family)